MDFDFTAQDEAFRKEVADFLDKELPPEVAAEVEAGQGPGPAAKSFYRKLGAKGWLTVNWPRKYGGLEGTQVQHLILQDELAYRRSLTGMVGAAMAGPCILLFGTDDLKEEFLPRISHAEIDFALGYTEPNAGSDLAALETRAVADGDDYVVNGQKIYNSSAHYADYQWLAARTDPDAPKHRGVSLFIVDFKTPGIEVQPLRAVDGTRHNVVYYDNVRVPKRYLVGEKNKGFYHIATALDLERIFPTGEFQRSFDDLVAFVKTTKRDGQPLADDPFVRRRIAQMAIEVEASRLLAYRVAWMIDNHTIPNTQASMGKLFLTESQQRFGIAAQQILGLYGRLEKDSPWAPLQGRFTRAYLGGFMRTIVQGTSEVQRNIIATRGLGLPR